MAVRGITSGAGSYLASSNPYQAVQTAYTQIQQNLTAGNLDGARQGFSALAKALQNSPIGQADSSVSGPVLKTLVDVATALQSGSLDGAKSAFSTLGQSINAAAQAAAVSPSTGAALSPQQLTTTLVSRILSQMNGSGSDPLIAAMGGGSSATTDPLLAALNGNDGKTGGDPLVAAMSSGVNIVV